MNGRPRLHYHSDCDSFAGCENMIANFLNDERISGNYDVTFSYRKSALYEKGFRSRVHREVRKEVYPLVAGNAVTELAARLPQPLRLPVKLAAYLLLVRYWLFIWNVLVLFLAWKSRGIDLLHINNGGYPGALSCQAAAVSARLAGIPRIVMVVNNIALPHRYRKWPLDYIVDVLVASSAGLFITGSLAAAEALRVELNLPRRKIVSLHNGVAGRQPLETREQTRMRLGVANDALLFGVVARLEWRKGHSVLLDAVSILKNSFPPIMPTFLIEGEGEERSSLDTQVRSLSIGENVRFIGNEGSVFDFMQALDVLILPSTAYEDFPNVILEAMSLGKPVIASRLAGIPEQVEDGVTGWLVEPGDSVALAATIGACIDSRVALPEMGARARMLFQTKFTADLAVARYLNLYHTLFN